MFTVARYGLSSESLRRMNLFLIAQMLLLRDQPLDQDAWHEVNKLNLRYSSECDPISPELLI